MTSKTQFTIGYFTVIGMFAFGLISNAKAECPKDMHKYLRSWAFPEVTESGHMIHVNLYNYGNSPIVVDSVQSSGSKTHSAAWLRSISSLSRLDFLGASDLGLRLDAEFNHNTNGRIGAQISHAVLGAQLVNFFSLANTPTYQPHLKGAVLPPGYGLMIRVEEKNMVLRVAFSWCE